MNIPKWWPGSRRKAYPFTGIKTIVSAPTVRVDRLWPEVQRVLDALGFPEAYVTDWSTLGDFDLSPERIADTLMNLHVGEDPCPLTMLSSSDLIVDVAEKLRGAH